ERVKVVNHLNPDLLISLHVGTSDNGAETGPKAFVSSKNPQHEKARLIAAKILSDLDAKQTVNIIDQDLHLLKHVTCAAVTLEMGYLSNELDRAQLTSEEGQKAIGHTILRSIVE